MCSLILRCCFCCSWQSSLFFFSLSLLSSKRKRGEFWGRRRIFSLSASRFCQSFLSFFCFLSTTCGRNVSSLRRRRFFFCGVREQSVGDSCDSLRERRHDVSCVYRSSSFSSLSPSSRACTACGVFSKMVFYLSVKRCFMFWCIFFHC